VKQDLLEIEKNLKSRKETDRIMWFSMWVLLSIASFGIAWFPMIYYLIKRRNAHFARQEKLEKLILSKLRRTKGAEEPKVENPVKSRNATAWALLSLLILPAFYVFYFLKSELENHGEHEHNFLHEIVTLAKESEVNLNIHGFAVTKSFAVDKYLILSIVTLGLATAYWLYRIFNDYNNHFKTQWKIEDELLSFLKEIDKKSS
jgi:hypothetical protein